MLNPRLQGRDFRHGRRSVHPMHGPNKFKLGVFSMNSDGGLTLTKVPERWPAIWSEIVEVSQLADRAGFEFLLPIARWKGFGGEMNSREWSYETLTHAAALGAVTKNIAVFATVHVPMVHPVFAAKALTTIDHVSNGRAGLNIVCGWNPEEFGMFGLELIEERYEQGLEWFEIMNRIYTADAPFDYDGKFYKLKAVSGKPRPLQTAAPDHAQRGVLAAGARVRRQGRRLSVHDLHRDREGPRAHRRHEEARGGREARGRRLHDLPCGVPPDAGRGRGLLRALRGDDGRQRRASITTSSRSRLSRARTTRKLTGCTASASRPAPAPIRWSARRPSSRTRW